MKFPEDFTTAPGFDPAEDHIGPFYFRKADETDPARIIHYDYFAFRIESRHCNEMDSAHGGVLMTFADFALCRAGSSQRRPGSGAQPASPRGGLRPDDAYTR